MIYYVKSDGQATKEEAVLVSSPMSMETFNESTFTTGDTVYYLPDMGSYEYITNRPLVYGIFRGSRPSGWGIGNRMKERKIRTTILLAL